MTTGIAAPLVAEADSAARRRAKPPVTWDRVQRAIVPRPALGGDRRRS